MNYTHRDLVFSELKQFLHSQGSKIKNVLEIGAGGNDNPNAVSSRQIFEREGINYTGVDKHAKEDSKIFKMDAHKLDFPDESFDMVYLCHTFEHLENPIQALKEVKRVLNKGGWLWMATPNPCEHHILLKDFDHIFVLEPMQMTRLLWYVGIEGASYKQYLMEGYVIPREQDINVITLGRKE